MSWSATLSLDYQSIPEGVGHKTDLRFLHQGPLRVLRSLYPEGPGVCHNVLVHPPSGIVGGDKLAIEVTVGEQAHALVTTPGATRFYRSDQAIGTQQVKARVASGGRLEWLPLENLFYSGCQAHNLATFELAAGAEMMGWDVMALGLPLADLPFTEGTVVQHLAVQGLWLERAKIKASDHRLLNSAVGWAGHRCMGTLFFAAANPLDRSRREALLEAARAALGEGDLLVVSGATAPNPNVVVVRALGPTVEPTIAALKSCWAGMRKVAWGLHGTRPRIWST